ncbi:hypothetical protein MMC07_002440 [Pseudocyphellaria aurata]|nr:hypothetical protein [Pseudocyphellaria aurata]
MLDPILTPKGEDECQQLRQIFPYHQSVDLLVVSPLRRTIYTALLGFRPEIERGVPVIALPEMQETSDLPCDTGSDAKNLKQDMDGKPVDLSLVHDGWNSKSGRWAPTKAAVDKRSRQARQWLKARPEKEIVVVTHGGLLHYFTEDWTDSDTFIGTGWMNTEFRSYHFIDAEADDEEDNASIIETAESSRRRKGKEMPLTKAERLQIRETALKTWEDQGLKVES